MLAVHRCHDRAAGSGIIGAPLGYDDRLSMTVYGSVHDDRRKCRIRGGCRLGRAVWLLWWCHDGNFPLRTWGICFRRLGAQSDQMHFAVDAHRLRSATEGCDRRAKML